VFGQTDWLFRILDRYVLTLMAFSPLWVAPSLKTIANTYLSKVWCIYFLASLMLPLGKKNDLIFT